MNHYDVLIHQLDDLERRNTVLKAKLDALLARLDKVSDTLTEIGDDMAGDIGQCVVVDTLNRIAKAQVVAARDSALAEAFVAATEPDDIDWWELHASMDPDITVPVKGES